MELPFRLPLPDSRRSAGFVLAIAVEALIFLAIVMMAPGPFSKPVRERTTGITVVLPEPEDGGSSPKAATKASEGEHAAGHAVPQPPSPATPIVPPPEAGSNGLPGIMPISLGAKNIGQIKPEPTEDTTTDSLQPDSKLVYGPGMGSGGQSYYWAKWYREPSQAILGAYLTKVPPPNSWVIVACHTLPNYRVDNCRLVAESPQGYGLGRAIRQTAGQFLIRPPVRNGKSLVGEWVQIKIDFEIKEMTGKPGGGADADTDR